MVSRNAISENVPATRLAPSAGLPAPAWRALLRDAVSSVGELCRLLGLAPAEVDADLAAHHDFPLRVPRGFVARMRPGDPADPLLRQVLPIGAELDAIPGFGSDPLAERAVRPARGVLHKYRGRVLLVATGACGIHCRYCFRRHYPYAEERAPGGGFAEAVAYIAADPTVEEVILSGGDPLSIADDRLAELVRELAAIPHLRRLRVHSRMPVVLPERVDDDLLAWLGGSRLQPVMVLHVNHPREIDAAVGAACERLRGAGVLLLNQAVLLAGINDDETVLHELGAALVANGVVPYYLHLLDRVAGAAHFEVEEERARELLRRLIARTSGYLVPRLVREVAGAAAKLPIDLCMNR